MTFTFTPPMALRLLVVDDELPILGLIKSMLGPLGCEGVTEADSLAAARLVQTRKFDGILLDAIMPGLDGFQLTSAVRKSPSNSRVPVVMLTGSDDVQTMRRGFQAGISLFLGKPISQERLAHTVNALRGAFLKEKRRYARLIFRGEVICRPTGSFLRPVKLGGLDLSEGGMALMHAPGLKVGQELDLQFKLPDSGVHLRLGARVVRLMAPDGIAVAFVNPGPDEHRAIQHYITGEIKG
ncbi:MAG: response regulator [Terriglobia bacterium]|jgi:CheY-like chemotaxis protein